MSGTEEKKTPQATEQYQAVLLNPDQFYARHTEDEIDLKELWQAVWQGKWIIIATTLFCATLAVAISLSLPNIYQSSATLISSDESGQFAFEALAARAGGLAATAGLNPGLDKAKVAVETLKSRVFLSQFIEKHNLKAEIFAIKFWDASNNKLIFDENIFNEQTKTWQWKTSSNWKKEQQPSDQEAVKALLENINVNFDKNTGIVEITASHRSPFVAQKWVQWLVDDINQYMIQQGMADAKKSIQYLNKKMAETPIAEMQKVLNDLIEEKTKAIMLAQMRDQYVLKIIDPAVVPENKAKPKRALICLMATLLGGMLGVTLVFVVRFIKGSI